MRTRLNGLKFRLRRLVRAVLLRDRPLMTKLTVFSTLLVVAPMTLVGIISYRESARTLEREARQYSWQIIEQVTHYVEDYLRGFEIDTLKIVNHPDTVAFLKLKTSPEGAARDADARREDLAPAVRNVLQNSAYSQSDVTNITLILDDVLTISSAYQEGASSVTGIEREPWYETAPVTGPPRVYSRVIEWNGRREPVLSIVKRIGHPRTLEPFGMLVIDLNYKRLHDVARKVQLGESGRGYLFMVNGQGRLVYHPNPALIGTQADEDVFRAMRGQDSGSFVAAPEDGPYLFTFSRSRTLDWWIATAIPYGELTRSSAYIGRTILATATVTALAGLLLSAGLALSLLNPIKRLYRYMKRVEIGDLSGRVPVDTTDEIGKLTVGFNKMVDRLAHLLEEVYVSKLKETRMQLRQKETELNMLQAQINPHFLYNSLETIRGMALRHDVPEIGVMASALARLLRYNVKNAGAIVTVRDELEMVNVYLRIQQFRFEDKLIFRLDVPEWALGQRIARFTLQPVVENCIVHAVERSLGRTFVHLDAVRTGERSFEIRVRDNGPGIPPDELERLRCRLAYERPEEAAHIGLLNVHRRLRHLFGETGGLRLDSVEGEGTEVGIMLPYEPRGSDEP